jgi:hypothetical protein
LSETKSGASLDALKVEALRRAWDDVFKAAALAAS